MIDEIHPGTNPNSLLGSGSTTKQKPGTFILCFGEACSVLDGWQGQGLFPIWALSESIQVQQMDGMLLSLASEMQHLLYCLLTFSNKTARLLEPPATSLLCTIISFSCLLIWKSDLKC